METQLQTIGSEDDAWRLLERWLNREEMDPESIDFQNWPVLQIKVRGEDYDSSLNASQMSALVDLKKTIGRAYASIAHGAYDMRRLKAEEEEQLEFTTTIRKGSSITDTDLTPLVQAVASIVTTHPLEALVAAAAIGLLFVARPIILKHYENRAKELEVDERRRLMDFSLTHEENQQYQTFERAVKRIDKVFPHFSRALPDAAAGFWRFASASADATNMAVAGIDLSQGDLELLSERRKQRPRDVSEVEQVFRVNGVTKYQGGYRIQLVSQNLIVPATYRRPQLTDARIKRLFGYMASGTSILAKVEIKVTDGSQVSGRLIRFKLFQDDGDNDEF